MKPETCPPGPTPIRPLNVVCFGGGTGLSTLLADLKFNPWLSISAIVGMFDNGGSSGLLRDKFGILPPGDILKCIVALSKHSRATREILLQRITGHELPNHSAGNLLLLGLEQVYEDRMVVVNALCTMLACEGMVYPVTLASATIEASFTDGTRTKGERDIDSAIFLGKWPSALSLLPDVSANQHALTVIEEADVFCIGPGSFYTSVLPNFLPIGIQEKLRESKKPIIFISNLLTEGDGMRNYTAIKMVQILEEYIGRAITKVIVNTNVPSECIGPYERERKRPVSLLGIENDNRFISAPLWIDRLARHDGRRLAFLLSNVIADVTRERAQ